MSKVWLSALLAIPFWACSDATDSLNVEEDPGSSLEKSSDSKDKSDKSSSSGKVNVSSSSGKVNTSSSSARSSSSVKSSSSKSEELLPLPEGTRGECVNVSGSEYIARGEITQFKLVFESDKVNVSDLVNAEFQWHYGNGAEIETSEETSSTSVSNQVMFLHPGESGVSVDVTIGDKSERYSCPLQITGAPVTGCQCNTDVTVLDIQEKSEATWTVSGCVSESPMSYEWNDETGTSETSYIKIFSDVAKSYAPTLKVTNEEGSQSVVTCPSIRVTDGPEYVINVEGDLSPRNTVEIPNGACFSVRGTWSDEYYRPGIVVTCHGQGGYLGESITISYEDRFVEQIKGDFYTRLLLDEQLSLGPIAYDGICIEFDSNEYQSVVCEVFSH